MQMNEFEDVMDWACVATQSEPIPGSYGIYFDRFSGWKQEDFEKAVKSACEGRRSFPPISDIIKHKPVTHSTGDLEKIKRDQRDYQSRILENKKPIPPHLKDLTDDELIDLFIKAGIPANHDVHIQYFRRGNTLWIEQIESVYG